MKACATRDHLQVCIFDTMIEVNIIGTGNVAWHLAKAFASENQVIVMQVAGRNLQKLKTFSQFAQETVSTENLTPAQVNIVAVRDDAIASVIEGLPFKDALVVHTSGFTKMEMDVEGSLSRKRNRQGVFYPLQSFSKEDQNINFSEIPILIEAQDSKDVKTLRILAEVISNYVQEINSDQRRKLHLAAVFANNFANHMFTVAKEICVESNIPYNFLHALIRKTADKAILNGPIESQTGPAKRRDKNVLKTQEAALKNAQHKEIYKTITQALQITYGKEL